MSRTYNQDCVLAYAIDLLGERWTFLIVAGGVASHMRERMQSTRLMAAAKDKGQMRGVVERTPIFLITQSRLGVQGAIASSASTTV